MYPTSKCHHEPSYLSSRFLLQHQASIYLSKNDFAVFTYTSQPTWVMFSLLMDQPYVPCFVIYVHTQNLHYVYTSLHVWINGIHDFYRLVNTHHIKITYIDISEKLHYFSNYLLTMNPKWWRNGISAFYRYENCFLTTFDPTLLRNTGVGWRHSLHILRQTLVGHDIFCANLWLNVTWLQQSLSSLSFLPKLSPQQTFEESFRFL